MLCLQLGEVPVCLSLYSDLAYQLADQKPAQLSLTDYYDPELQLKSTYAVRQGRALEDSCPECWPTAEEEEQASSQHLHRHSFAAGTQANASTGAGAPALSLLVGLLVSVVLVPVPRP